MIMPMPQIYHIHDSRPNCIAILESVDDYSVAVFRALLSGVQLNLQDSWLPKVHIATRYVLC